MSATKKEEFTAKSEAVKKKAEEFAAKKKAEEVVKKAKAKHAKQDQLMPNQEPQRVPVEIPAHENEFHVRLQYDLKFNRNGYKGVEIAGNSETQPDHTLTIRQMLTRHMRGQDDHEHKPLYFETQVPIFHDLTDVEAYHENLTQRKKEVEDFIKQQKAEQAEEKKQRAAQKAAQKASQDITPDISESKAKGGQSEASGRQLRIDDSSGVD